MTIDDIEKRTGLDFFPAIANEAEDLLEAKKAERPGESVVGGFGIAALRALSQAARTHRFI